MKNNYIPEIFKEKSFIIIILYFYIIFIYNFYILSAIALLTFDINDNSFLTSTSNTSQNLLGDFGSYFASFIFYTFGILGYLIILFFLIYFFIGILLNKPPKYIFIRLLLFFISLILIPQTFINLEFKYLFIDSIETWGIFANHIYNFIITLIILVIYYLLLGFLLLFFFTKYFLFI